jgi:TonB family protein
MRNILAALAMLLCLSGMAQEADSTIYEVAETTPFALLKSCSANAHPDWTIDSIKQCAETQLLQLVAANIRYPDSARLNNTQGTVVLSILVETNGKISDVGILKDIGDGCGAEAKRVMLALNEAGLYWQPATINKKPVRMRVALPLRFRLQEALPYVINPNGDTIHTVIDSLPVFRNGEDDLVSFVLNTLQYPPTLQDSCQCGIIEMALLIKKDGSIQVENQLDYNQLGLDFQFEAIRLSNRFANQWHPAYYKGQAVNTTYPIRVLFKSPKEHCKSANDRFDQAMLLANEAADLADQGKQEEALVKWNEALNLSPNNTELLYYRGNTLFALDKRDEACEDYTLAKQLLGKTWFDNIGRLLCNW